MGGTQSSETDGQTTAESSDDYNKSSSSQDSSSSTSSESSGESSDDDYNKNKHDDKKKIKNKHDDKKKIKNKHDDKNIKNKHDDKKKIKNKHDDKKKIQNKHDDKKKIKNKHDEKKEIKFVKCKEKFYCSDKGVFYDNEMIRIKFRMKKEGRISWGLSIIFMNKTNIDISSINFVTFFPVEALELIQDTSTPRWNGGTLRANAEKHLKFVITCLDYFEEQPIFRVMFVHKKLSWKIQMNLPIYIHKFLAPDATILTGFNQDWDYYLRKGRKDVVSFQSTDTVATEKFIPRLEKYLENFGFFVHYTNLVSDSGFVYAGKGIIHTKSGVYCCLLKLIREMDFKKSLWEYRLSLRTSLPSKHFKSSEYILSILGHEIREAEKPYH